MGATHEGPAESRRKAIYAQKRPGSDVPMAGELEVIRRICEEAKTRNAAVRVGIGDDCAVLKTLPGHELVVTTDFCLEGKALSSRLAYG